MLAPVEPTEEDAALAEKLLAESTPQDIAMALVQAHRARMPQPEELLVTDAPPPRGPRAGFEGSQWFRLNVGRRQNADPRWILPLLCRRGHVSRQDIGAIRLTANETLFEIAAPAAVRFLEAVGHTGLEDDDGVEITRADGPPREEARAARKEYRGQGGQRKEGGSPRPAERGPRKEFVRKEGARAGKPHADKPRADGPRGDKPRSGPPKPYAKRDGAQSPRPFASKAPHRKGPSKKHPPKG